MTAAGAKAGASLLGIIVGSTVFVAAILGLVYYLGALEYVERLFVWIEGLGIWGPVLYLFLHALVIVFLLPGVFFTLGAGFLFGVVKGSIVIVLGTTLGASIAFAIARYCLGERAKAFLLAHEKTRAVTSAISTGGWKVILCSRLIPFFPFKASNYVFGLMDFRFKDFFIGTLIGVIPLTMTNVYVGWLAGDFATATAADRSRTPLEWGLYGFGLIVAVVFLAWIGRRADRALRELESQRGAHAPAEADLTPSR